MILNYNKHNINLSLVLRHKWDKESKARSFRTDFRDYKLGVWFKKSKIVGKRHFNDPKKWGNNLVGDYMFGIDLLVFKIWIAFDYGGLHGKI